MLFLVMVLGVADLVMVDWDSSEMILFFYVSAFKGFLIVLLNYFRI